MDLKTLVSIHLKTTYNSCPALNKTRSVSASAAFANMLQEIEENGWKQPKGIKNKKQRSSLVAKPVYKYRDDDDSDEDEEDDDAEDDEPFAPDFDTMFPNPEGKPSGPTSKFRKIIFYSHCPKKNIYMKSMHSLI
jgi:hypothetical protein